MTKLIENAFSRHEFGVLQYSGGKDSTACLMLLKPWWHKLKIVWVDTGDSYPELEKEICHNVQEAEAFGSEFIIVHSDVLRFTKVNGFPADLVPSALTPLGAMVNPAEQRPLVIDKYMCCAANLWLPLQSKMKEIGATLIIRGSRIEEGGIMPDVIDDVEFLYPIKDWSTEEVIDYLELINKLPQNYHITDVSLDCMHCTAWWKYLVGGKTLKYLKAKHPEVHAEVTLRLSYIASEAARELTNLNGYKE